MTRKEMQVAALSHRSILSSALSHLRNMKSFEHYLQLSTVGCEQGRTPVCSSATDLLKHTH